MSKSVFPKDINQATENILNETMREHIEIPIEVQKAREAAFTRIREIEYATNRARIDVPEMARDIEASNSEDKECKRGSTSHVFWGKRFGRLAASFAAAAVIGTVTFASFHFHLADLFQREMSSEEAQRRIVTDFDATVTGQTHVPAAYTEEGTEELFWGRKVIPDTSALLTIEEAQYDGICLYIYASTTENGRQYTLNTDRLYINEQEWGPVSTDNLNEWTGEEGYTFQVDLSDLDLEKDFSVILPLSVYKGGERYQNQELSFMMSAQPNLKYGEEQHFEHEGYSITVRDVIRSSNVVRFKVCYEISGDELKKLNEQEQSLVSSVVADIDLQAYACSVREQGEGAEESYELAGLDPDKKRLSLQTILCEKGGYVHDGKVIAEDVLLLP